MLGRNFQNPHKMESPPTHFATEEQVQAFILANEEYYWLVHNPIRYGLIMAGVNHMNADPVLWEGVQISRGLSEDVMVRFINQTAGVGVLYFQEYHAEDYVEALAHFSRVTFPDDEE